MGLYAWIKQAVYDAIRRPDVDSHATNAQHDAASDRAPEMLCVIEVPEVPEETDERDPAIYEWMEMSDPDYLILDSDGYKEKRAHAIGDYLAFCCDVCGHPVLAVAREGQPGSDDDTPTTCVGCGTEWCLDVRRKKLYIHSAEVSRRGFAEMQAELKRRGIID